jgi:nicotinic acid phosphoribosyltransferase
MMAPSLLATDGYKFSMAEAGWPLRQEVFYYTHRKGGPQLIPFDARQELQKLLPSIEACDFEYLAHNEYEMGAGFKAAIAQTAAVGVQALPKGSWFLPREPVLSVSGPSALVSWLEPLLLQLNYRIQIATLAVTDAEALAREVASVTCGRQRDIVLETLDSVGVPAPGINVEENAYAARVLAQARELADITGDAGRIFEVGLRAATCLEQHLLALKACAEAGIRRTSDVFGARELGMIPVGTMGHEHVQRYGSDAAAFRAMRDRRPQRSSYLLDTFDTLRSGIPAAFDLIQECGAVGDSIRYDSGDKEGQYRFAVANAKRRGIRPVQIIEDGCDAAMTRRFEALRVEAELGPHEQFYGYGGYLVAKTMGSELTRDRVSAVYKLSKTACFPSMKFADEAGSGKESVPGEPVVWRRSSGSGSFGIIAQASERVPAGYVRLSGAETSVGARPSEAESVELSPETSIIARNLRAQRQQMIERAAR